MQKSHGWATNTVFDPERTFTPCVLSANLALAESRLDLWHRWHLPGTDHRHAGIAVDVTSSTVPERWSGPPHDKRRRIGRDVRCGCPLR